MDDAQGSDRTVLHLACAGWRIASERRNAHATESRDAGTELYVRSERAAMFIRIGYEIVIDSKADTVLILALSPHSSFDGRIVGSSACRRTRPCRWRRSSTVSATG
jgi:hypothetical protein